MHDDATSESGTVGRRSLVRVGATAAWAVPVVVMAAPAQAATCSGGSTTLTAIKLAGTQAESGSPKLTVSLQVQVCNTGHSGSCGLSATATAVEASTKLNGLTVGSWPAATVGGGGSSSMTVSAPATEQLGAGTCATYLVTYVLHDGSGDHNVTITFRTTNGAAAAVTVRTTR